MQLLVNCISQKLVAKLIAENKISFSNNKTFCERYAFGTQHQPLFPSHFVHERGQKANFYKHKVICDPMNANFFGRPQYYTGFIQGRF